MNIVNLHNWSQGSFSGMTWDNVRMILWIVAVTMVVTFFLAKPIGAYQLGESYARNMGVNVKALRIGLILLSSMLSACGNRFCRTNLFCGNRGAASGKTDHKNGKTDYYDTGMFPVWRGGDAVL